MKISNFNMNSGRMIREDGSVVNIADILTSDANAVSDIKERISSYQIHSGRFIREDGTIVNLADLIADGQIGGGGGGTTNYKSAENNGVSITKMHVDENIGEKTRHRFGTNFYPGYAYAKDILCSHLALVVTMDSYDFAFYVLGSGQLVIYAMDDTGISTLEEMQSYWNGLSDVTFWYETAEETFVPLSESEQEALNALHTFRPTTVLSNDCDCNMSLTYKTKKSLEVTT